MTTVQISQAVIQSYLPLPIYISRVSAGFPSPADDYIEKKLDLNEHLIKKPAATFFVKIKGDSMQDAGMQEGDLLIVDRSQEANHKSIVLAVLNGEFTIKRLIKKDGKTFLFPENQKYKPIEINDEMNFEVWGVVAHVIHTPK
jgi:DNA polymerase V